MEAIKNSQSISKYTNESSEILSPSSLKKTRSPTSTRFTLQHKTATSILVGPGKYEEKRTAFPVIDGFGQLLPQEKQKCKPQCTFKSHSPRISPVLLSDAPLPGRYNYKSIAQEISSKNAKLKAIKLTPKKKRLYSVKAVPGPGAYKIEDSLQFIDSHSYKKSRVDGIFASKTERNSVKSTYYIGMGSPPIGKYNDEHLTISDMIEKKMRKLSSPKKMLKNSQSTLGFESRVMRFNKMMENDLGPGRYEAQNGFEENNLLKKPNPLIYKTERFLDLSEVKKYPGPGSYKTEDSLYKPGFSIFNPKF